MLGIIGQRKGFARPQSVMPILAVLAVSALSACSKAILPAVPSSGASIATTSGVVVPSQPFAQTYSAPVAKGLSSVNVSFNNSKAYALTTDDLNMLQSAGLLDNDDAAALQPFVKVQKN